MKFIYSFFILFVIIFYSCGQQKNEIETEPPKPLSGNCTYIQDGSDSSGRRVKIIQDEKFISFSFTDSSSGNDEIVGGYLGCFSIDSTLGINLNFKVHSSDAFKYYGLIKKDNKINFILKSGRAVELPFGNTVSGNTNLSQDYTEYTSFTNLSKSQSQQLTSEELERVKISWSKKEEDYSVINPKIFINQIPCVK